MCAILNKGTTGDILDTTLLKKLSALLTKSEKKEAAFIFLNILFGSFLELMAVSALMPIIDIALGTEDSEGIFYRLFAQFAPALSKEKLLLYLIFGTVLLYVFKSFYLSWMYGTLYDYAARTKRRMAVSLMDAYLRKPYPFFLYRPSSELIRSVNSDTAQLYEVLVNTAK